jgi:hypothetical protein
VRTGNADYFPVLNGFGERFGSTRDRNSELSRARNLRVIPIHCRCHDQLARAIDVIGTVAPGDVNPELDEVIDDTRICVTPGDGNSPPRQQLGERAHAGAGDANEVNRTAV